MRYSQEKREEIALNKDKTSVKYYLLSAFYTIKEIQEKERLLEDLIKKQSPKPITIPNLEKIGNCLPSIISANSVYNQIIKLQQEIVKLNENVNEAKEFINKIKQPQLRAVLKYRYIEGLHFSKIAQIMCYTERQIFNLHNLALREFEKIFQ